MKFEIGNRVTVIDASYEPNIAVGSQGTIIGTQTIGDAVAVQFDKDIGGHDSRGFGAKGKFGYCWNYWESPAKYLKKLNNNKILITSDGSTTLARLYEGNKVVKSAEAKCAPSDTYNFNIGAQLAYNRLVYGTDYNPAEVAFKSEPPKHEYKVGDTVKCTKANQYYFTVGKTYKIGNEGRITADDGFEFCENSVRFLFGFGTYFEPYAEPPKPAVPKQEPIKLYCVKDHMIAFGLTKGKIYAIDADGKCLLDGESDQGDRYVSFEDFAERNRSYAKCLVPLVSRPAKVGEWVYVIDSDVPVSYREGYKIGDIFQVSELFGSGAICKPFHLANREYLVLDGYIGEENPKYWNGKVVCVKAEPNNHLYTIGKVYTITDGKFTSDKGTDPFCEKVLSINHLNGILSESVFIEFKGES